MKCGRKEVCEENKCERSEVWKKRSVGGDKCGRRKMWTEIGVGVEKCGRR